MKTAEERLEELETAVAALVVLSTCGLAAAVGDEAVQLIRTIATRGPDLSKNVRNFLHRLADAAEGRQK